MAENSLHGARLGIVGTGVMAEAMLAGLLGERLLEAAHVTCSHPREGRRAALDQTYGVGTTESNAEAVRGADIVLLAVKPQMLAEVIPELRGTLRPEQLVISAIPGTMRPEVITNMNVVTTSTRARPPIHSPMISAPADRRSAYSSGGLHRRQAGGRGW